MIKVYSNNKTFLNDYQAYLLKDEVKYNLMLGISNKDNDSFTFISSVVDDRFLIGIMAGKNLILASNTIEDNVYDEMIEYMDHIDYPGIIGTREHCEKYNELYIMKYGVSLVIKMNQRIYRCDKVNNYSKTIGIVRLATEKDIEVLKHWALDFYVGIEPNTTLLKSEESVIEKIKRKVLFVLVVNGVMVSMTVRARAINKTETVSFVYTPHKFRRKGFASRIVEEVTRYIHSDGRIATLYTDLDNSISNSIRNNYFIYTFCNKNWRKHRADKCVIYSNVCSLCNGTCCCRYRNVLEYRRTNSYIDINPDWRIRNNDNGHIGCAYNRKKNNSQEPSDYARSP